MAFSTVAHIVTDAPTKGLLQDRECRPSLGGQ